MDAMLIMGKYGVHRIPVVNPAGIIVNFLTQSAIVDQLSKVLLVDCF